MKKILLSFVVFAIAIATSLAQNTVVLKTGENLNDKAAELSTIFQKSPILEGVSNMKNFALSEDEATQQQYISAEGTNKNQNRIIFRAKVRVQPTRSGMKLHFGAAPSTESCTSNGCDLCSFAQNGGCNCTTPPKDGKSPQCNHSISN